MMEVGPMKITSIKLELYKKVQAFAKEVETFSDDAYTALVNGSAVYERLELVNRTTNMREELDDIIFGMRKVDQIYKDGFEVKSKYDEV